MQGCGEYPPITSHLQSNKDRPLQGCVYGCNTGRLGSTVCHSLDQALEHLDKDRAFLTKGGVFTDSMIDAYIDLKMNEVTRFRMAVHPVEYDMYYSL